MAFNNNDIPLSMLACIALVAIGILLFSGVARADVVIETICYEAMSEPLEGQVAVARVIRNRAVNRRLTFEEVCLQPYQFSCWNKGTKLPIITPRAYQRASRAWELSKDSELTANLYYNPALCSPYWASSDKVEYIQTIGNHIFMKE